jgi:hypothetical protein
VGDTLNQEVMQSFFAELEKQAAGERIAFHGLRELAKRFSRGGLRRGWDALSPTKLIQQGGKSGKAMEQAVARTQAAEEALQTGGRAVTRRAEPIQGELFAKTKAPKMPSYTGETPVGRARAHLATHLRAGTHLAPDATVSPGVRGAFERLSRGGWTGEGAITKYLPFGQKGMLALGTATSAPGIVEAARKGPSAEGGGLGEQLGGAAGFLLPSIMFGGMPTASLLATIPGMMGGAALGRMIDKLDPRRPKIQPQPQVQPQVQRQATPPVQRQGGW